MTGPEILKAMDKGSTLHGGRFGFWLMSMWDARCTNVHNGAAKSLVRRGLIKKVDDTQYVKTEIRAGDKVKASRRIGHGLAEKGEPMTVLDDRGNGWFLVQPDGGYGFLTKRADFIPLHNAGGEGPPRGGSNSPKDVIGGSSPPTCSSSSETVENDP